MFSRFVKSRMRKRERVTERRFRENVLVYREAALERLGYRP